MYHFDATGTTPVDLESTQNVHIFSQDDHCTAVAIHKEASKTNRSDQRAVYQVIRNRMRHSRKTACGVIKEAGQFSFVRKGMNWTASSTMLLKLQQAESHKDVFGKNVLYFHNNKVHPSWTRHMKLVAIIGNHMYYAPIKRKG
jgi:spore germination cell wall hydrolase CwlJ-like protein